MGIERDQSAVGTGDHASTIRRRRRAATARGDRGVWRPVVPGLSIDATYLPSRATMPRKPRVSAKRPARKTSTSKSTRKSTAKSAGSRARSAAARIQRIQPCLWFDHQAEDAARLYTSVFADSRILSISRYGKAGFEIHGRPAGSVMTVQFELEGQRFTGLNGGPAFRFNEAISFEIHCETQQEIDHYWDRLSEGGDPKAQQCGWLKDRFGVSWQVVPKNVLGKLMDGSAGSQRAFAAMLKMKKLDIAALEKAYNG